MDHVEVIVIGAGIVGLACAREFAMQGREVIILESADAIGTGISSRHSEVIHAGFYYPTGSLKARLCVEGKQLLYDYCRERKLDHKQIGKLLVATNEAQIPLLSQYEQQGLKNGVTDLEMIFQEVLSEMEPNIKGLAALWSPSTGIFDSHSIMLNFLGDIEDCGGRVAYNSRVAKGVVTEDKIILHLNDAPGTVISASCVINSGGLYACDIANCLDNLNKEYVPELFFAKGHYFSLQGASPFNHLVYPVPEQAGLGIHATIDLGGQVRFGPDVEWVESVHYDVSADRAPLFVERIQHYYPDLNPEDLVPAYAGIRPKITGPDQNAADFMISGPNHHGVNGLVNLFGIESPGATSSLAIGKYVADLL